MHQPGQKNNNSVPPSLCFVGRGVSFLIKISQFVFQTVNDISTLCSVRHTRRRLGVRKCCTTQHRILWKPSHVCLPTTALLCLRPHKQKGVLLVPSCWSGKGSIMWSLWPFLSSCPSLSSPSCRSSLGKMQLTSPSPPHPYPPLQLSPRPLPGFRTPPSPVPGPPASTTASWRPCRGWALLCPPWRGRLHWADTPVLQVCFNTSIYSFYRLGDVSCAPHLHLSWNRKPHLEKEDAIAVLKMFHFENLG